MRFFNFLFLWSNILLKKKLENMSLIVAGDLSLTLIFFLSPLVIIKSREEFFVIKT